MLMQADQDLQETQVDHDLELEASCFVIMAGLGRARACAGSIVW